VVGDGALWLAPWSASVRGVCARATVRRKSTAPSSSLSARPIPESRRTRP